MATSNSCARRAHAQAEAFKGEVAHAFEKLGSAKQVSVGIQVVTVAHTWYTHAQPVDDTYGVARSSISQPRSFRVARVAGTDSHGMHGDFMVDEGDRGRCFHAECGAGNGVSRKNPTLLKRCGHGPSFPEPHRQTNKWVPLTASQHFGEQIPGQGHIQPAVRSQAHLVQEVWRKAQVKLARKHRQ